MIESKFLSQFIMQENLSIILTPMFCKHVINKFEQDERTQPGSIGAGRNDDDIKRSTDLYISEFKDWEHEHNRFQQAYNQVMMSYAANIREEVHDIVNPFARTKKKTYSGFQVQRTKPGEFYTWHTDEYNYSWMDPISRKVKLHQRALTYIFYLNDVEHDGYTEFIDGTKVQPQAGKALVFPATWTFLHRGFPPKDETKYICTGWTSGVTFYTKDNLSPEVDWKYDPH